MNEDQKIRDTLSALLDGEANELEVQRLLKQPIPSDALAAMRRYQSVRSVLAGHRNVAAFDVSSRVAEAVRHEAALSRPHEPASVEMARQQKIAASVGSDQTSTKGWRQLVGGVAIAASVAFAVILSPQLLRDTSPEAPMQTAQLPLIPAQTLSQTPAQSLAQSPVRQGPSSVLLQQGSLASTASMPERNLDEEHMRRLNEYLMRHAEHAALNNGQGMVPYARLAGFESSQNPQR